MKKTLTILICFLFIFGTLACTGMPTIKWKSTTQKQVAILAVSIGAKAIGLKLASSGFIWTDEIESIYKFVSSKDKITLDAAQLAERYVRDSVDPLVAPDILELAKMVGFEFDGAGHVIGTSGVDVELLKTAAFGFRLAVTTRQNATISVKEYYENGFYPYEYYFGAYPEGDSVVIGPLYNNLVLYDK